MADQPTTKVSLGSKRILLSVAVVGVVIGGLAGAQSALLSKTPVQTTTHYTVSKPVPSMQPNLSANAALTAASKAMSQKDYATAIKDYKQGLASNPAAQEKYGLWLGLGSAYNLTADYKDAETAYQNATQANGKDGFPDIIGQATAYAGNFFATVGKSHSAVTSDAAERQTALTKFAEAKGLTTDKTIIAQINAQVTALNQVK